jgi:hypothetical protein
MLNCNTLLNKFFLGKPLDLAMRSMPKTKGKLITIIIILENIFAIKT